MGKKKLIIHDVNKSFVVNGQSVDVLKDINLEIEEGDFVVIVGHSGCGKSTLLKMIAGLEKNDTGILSVDGKEVDGPGMDRGMIFQEHRLFPWMSIEKNVQLGLKGLSKEEKRKLSDQYLELVKLSEFKKAYPSQLSGGMSQRAAIARSLVSQPEILLLDEPFAALDSYLKWKMEQQMMDLLKDIQKPALFVSHSRDEVYRLCDTVSCINQGKMEVIEPVKEFFKNPKTKTAALLSGCKNICSVELVKDLEPTETPMQDKSFGKLWAAEWGVAFDVSKEALTARTVGIRAHYLMQKKPKEGHITELTVGEYRILEDPFEWNISFRKDENCEWLQWKISKSDWNPSVGVPKVLYAREEDLLLLDRE